MEHWLDRERRKLAQDKMSVFGWDDELFLENFRHSRHVRSYWIYVYLSGLMRYHL